METSVVPVPSRDIPDSAHGQEVWPGQCAVLPNSSNGLNTIDEEELVPLEANNSSQAFMLKAAKATCDFYIENTPIDGVPYWDTGAPGLHLMGDYLDRPQIPLMPFEPVDSSAAAIASQGLFTSGEIS